MKLTLAHSNPGGVMSVEMVDYNWRAKAVCYGASDEELFPEDPANDQAVRTYCRVCPVRESCLKDALRLGVRDGVRGGLTEAVRMHLHDAAEAKTSTLTARKMAIGRKCHLSLDDKIGLADLRNQERQGSTQSDKRAFRMRLGELYEAGVEKSELLDTIEATFPTRHAAERLFWRGVKEYRDALEAESPGAPDPAPQDEVHIAVIYSIKPKSLDRALENFLHMAEQAPTDMARKHWHAKALALA